MFNFPNLSNVYKTMLLISVFFLVNSVVSMNIEFLAPFTAYLVGFSIGCLSVFLGFGMHRSKRDIDASDVQVEIAVDLCKQFASLPMKIIKGTPVEVYQLIFACRAHFFEHSKPIEICGSHASKHQDIVVV